MGSTDGVNGLLIALVLLGQTPPPLVPFEPEPQVLQQAPLEPVVGVEDGTDPIDRSTWRLHFAAGAGLLGFSSAGSSPSASSAGAFLSVGKPLYVGDRHPHHQWVTDSTFFLGYAPGTKTALLVISPTFGTNWYFGSIFGLEWRAGIGFGATPGVLTNVGVGICVEGSLVFRPFKDDQKRIKLQGHEILSYGLIGTLSVLTTVGFAVAYEMPL